MGKWPEKFLSEIKEILHDEYDAFLRAMDDESLSVLRINPRRENAFPFTLSAASFLCLILAHLL